LFGKRHCIATFEIELAFADHMHQFNAGQDIPGGLKRFKCRRRFGDALDCTMVLLDDIVEVLDLPSQQKNE